MAVIVEKIGQKIGETWNVCVDSKVRTPLNEDESIRCIKGAKRTIPQGTFCIGKLVITNERIIFESDTRNKSRVINDVILLKDIRKYCIADSIHKPTQIVVKGLTKDNALFVTTEHEEYFYYFNPQNLQDINDVVMLLESSCPNAIRGEKAKRMETFTGSRLGKRYSLNDIIPKNASAKMSEEEKISMLKEYKMLLDEGIISQEEFDSKKAELLK